MIDRIRIKFAGKMWKVKKKLNYYFYTKLRGDNSGISIISCNCTGGVVMSEYNMKFLTPTVNLFMMAEDFLKFVENIKYYCSIEPTEFLDENADYPIALIDDIKVFAVHYDSFRIFYDKWEERKKRINYNRIFCIFCDRDGFDQTMLERIKNLPYEKIVFMRNENIQYSFVQKIKGFENESCIGVMTDYVGWLGKRRYSNAHFGRRLIQMIRKD